MTNDELKRELEALSVPLKPDEKGTFRPTQSGEDSTLNWVSAAPKTVVEIQKIVKWAREKRTPLVPVSSGAPHIHNKLSDLTADSGVIVDLSGLKKIIKVNRRNRMALVEAGVTFGELIEQARKEGLRVNTPLCPRASKSIVTSYLEREPTILSKYQWDLSDPLLCTELVYGTGDYFRTGSAAGPGTIEEQWKAGEYQKSPMGPGQNDFVRMVQGAQGTIAIVTWASFKCEILPNKEQLYAASSTKLESLIEFAYRLERKKLAEVCFIVDANAYASLTCKNSKERLNTLKTASPWCLIFSIAGFEYFPKKRLSYCEGEILRYAKEEGVTLGEPSNMRSDSLLELLYTPSEEPYWKFRPLGAMRDVFFQTTMDRSPRFISDFIGLAKDAGIEDNDIGTYIQPQLNGRVCHLEFIVGYNPDNKSASDRVNTFANGVVEPLLKIGGFFSRPYGAWTAPALTKYSGRRIMERTKTIFDPDGILSPGRLTMRGVDHVNFA